MFQLIARKVLEKQENAVFPFFPHFNLSLYTTIQTRINGLNTCQYHPIFQTLQNKLG